jgi:ATP-dependent DNA helicase RecG
MKVSSPRPPETSPSYRKPDVAPEDCRRALQTALRFLKGVGPKRAAQLEGLGLKTVEDLLYHLPFRYEDRRQIKKIGQASIGGIESFIGQLVRLEKKYLPHRRRQILLAMLADESGSIGLTWYRAPAYLSQGLSKGQRLLVHGKVEHGVGVQKRITHPEFQVLEPANEQDVEKILPIYLRPGGVPLGTMRKWLVQALDNYGKDLSSFLPEPVVRRQGLMDLRQAMFQVHRPEKEADCISLNRFASDAHRSIIFDELFYLQLGLGLRKKYRAQSEGIAFDSNEPTLTSRMRPLLPFELTGAQERVLGEVCRDMESARPMQRLIQGDVGSGKTIVAWLASLRAMESGYQVVWMAPTELLAEQHFRNLRQWADALGIEAALVTGSLPAKAKKILLQKIARAEIRFVIGTHALIQEGVRAPRMGLGVIDEQHRFGVLQRLNLQRLSEERGGGTHDRQPDLLLMSATPIPRSLAMVLYGDMEVSFLDEMPPGRKPVRTKVFAEKERVNLYRFVLQELQKEHQSFIVYPLVEPSEQLQQLRDATRMAEELARGIFKNTPLALVHGRMHPAERDQVMRSFRDGEARVLVATTVIEVGIDIPNATVMVVEHAERFGLSQLHQLRGRVGRGKASGYCLLVNYGSREGDAARRLQIMEETHDGFKIAEADLALRGPGELLGTRQSGLADFRLANLTRDSQLLLQAREEALNWLKVDPLLKNPESRLLRQILKYRWGERLKLGAVG